MKLEVPRVLSDEEVRQIHEATVAILGAVGVEVNHRRMLDRLAACGLQVDRDKRLVRFPRPVLEDALGRIPSRFEVFDREGQSLYTLGDGSPRVAAGHNAVFWVDSATGQTRPSTVADVEFFARICEHLPGIDMIGIPVMPQDVADPRKTLLHGVRACVLNSRKPIFFSTDSARINRGVMEILKRAFAGDLRHQVYGITQLSPTSPLFWEEGVMEAIADTIDTGVPIAILPEPNAGVSAPFTLAGLLTVNNAECVSGLAMIQLLKPGAKVMYATSWTTTDMRSGAALVGSAETSLCKIAGAQLARRYRVPSHTTSPNSDNHAHDEQNAWEKTLSQFCGMVAGHDLLVNCGMFATGMTCSHEQLLMDEEISNLCRRITAGVRVNRATIAEDLIATIGPHGTGYLTADHTIERLRSDEYMTPRIAVRGPRTAWEGVGAPDTYALAKQQVANFRQAPGAPLVERRASQIEAYLRGFRI